MASETNETLPRKRRSSILKPQQIDPCSELTYTKQMRRVSFAEKPKIQFFEAELASNSAEKACDLENDIQVQHSGLLLESKKMEIIADVRDNNVKFNVTSTSNMSMCTTVSASKMLTSRQDSMEIEECQPTSYSACQPTNVTDDNEDATSDLWESVKAKCVQDLQKETVVLSEPLQDVTMEKSINLKAFLSQPLEMNPKDLTNTSHDNVLRSSAFAKTNVTTSKNIETSLIKQHPVINETYCVGQFDISKQKENELNAAQYSGDHIKSTNSLVQDTLLTTVQQHESMIHTTSLLKKEKFQDSTPFEDIAVSNSLYGQRLEDLKITLVDDEDIENQKSFQTPNDVSNANLFDSIRLPKKFNLIAQVDKLSVQVNANDSLRNAPLSAHINKPDKDELAFEKPKPNCDTVENVLLEKHSPNKKPRLSEEKISTEFKIASLKPAVDSIKIKKIDFPANLNNGIFDCNQSIEHQPLPLKETASEGCSDKTTTKKRRKKPKHRSAKNKDVESDRMKFLKQQHHETMTRLREENETYDNLIKDFISKRKILDAKLLRQFDNDFEKSIDVELKPVVVGGLFSQIKSAMKILNWSLLIKNDHQPNLLVFKNWYYQLTFDLKSSENLNGITLNTLPGNLFPDDVFNKLACPFFRTLHSKQNFQINLSNEHIPPIVDVFKMIENLNESIQRAKEVFLDLYRVLSRSLDFELTDNRIRFGYWCTGFKPRRVGLKFDVLNYHSSLVVSSHENVELDHVVKRLGEAITTKSPLAYLFETLSTAT